MMFIDLKVQLEVIMFTTKTREGKNGNLRPTRKPLIIDDVSRGDKLLHEKGVWTRRPRKKRAVVA